jgi:hypothetical protein
MIWCKIGGGKLSNGQLLKACKQYCLVAGTTQGNIAYTQTIIAYFQKSTIQICRNTYRNINGKNIRREFTLIWRMNQKVMYDNGEPKLYDILFPNGNCVFICPKSIF